MGKATSRTPRGYDGTKLTTHKLGDVLASVLAGVSAKCQDRPDLILSAWPAIIGAKLAPMTEAVSFYDGILTIKVKNSTLHNLLSRYEKTRILSALHQKFPKVNIKNILFRIA